MRTLGFCLAFALVALLAMGVSADSCRTHADCPGYKENSFCARIECDTDANTCVKYPNPCPAVCIEEERRCVDCMLDSDCSTNLCDLGTNKCKPCKGDSDCPETDWCHGSHEVCDVRTGTCKPGRSPCENPETCISSLKQCFVCRKDEDCGEYNFCSHPVVCDRTTGACVEHVPFCKDTEVCDPAREQCVECLSDEDCGSADAENLFCTSPQTCNVEKGTCESGSATLDPCNPAIQPGDALVVRRCNEARKECINKICLSDSDCDDGDCQNGVEHCERHVCVRKHSADCNADSNESSAGDKEREGQRELLGSTCRSPEDCSSEGYICKIVSSKPPLKRECRPCNTDAECSDGNPANGDEACNLDTGRCQWPGVIGGNDIGTIKPLHANHTYDTPLEYNRKLVKDLQNLFIFDLSKTVENGSNSTGFFGRDPVVGGLLVLLIVIGAVIVIFAILFCIFAFQGEKKKSKGSKKM